MEKIDLSLIVAMTLERVIGNGGRLPWERIPSDIHRFKTITTTIGTVIMGRKTWESLPERFRPLPGRKNIVLTRESAPTPLPASTHFVSSIEEACKIVATLGGKACIIGGAEIYALFLANPHVKRVHLTLVHAFLPGDAHFPGLDKEWASSETSPVQIWHPDDPYETSFHLFERA